MEILRVENLTKIYGKGENEVRALDGVSFSVEKGEFTAIIGSSGSGKSTLLHLIGGVDTPSAGKVFVDGTDVYAQKEEALAISDRIAVMKEGRIMQIGTPREIYAKPTHPFVAGFIGVSNFLNCTVNGEGGRAHIAIAGMGGEEIVKILSDGFLPPKLVLQPMKKAEKVRAFLLGRGYALLRDHTFYADKKFYDLIKAVKGGKQEEYNKDMLSFGRENILSPTEDFAKMLERDIARCREWRESAAEGRAEIDARLKKLEGLYDETCRRLRSH